MVHGRHRAIYRKGPEHRWSRRRAEIVAKLMGPARVLDIILSDWRCVQLIKEARPDGHAIVLRGRVALDDWRPLANDTEGKVFE